MDTEVFMNPIRQRIIQYLLLNDMGTAGEILAEMTDIAPATMYRHIKVLLENDCIEVVNERKVRGTVEKTYALVKQPAGGAEINQEEILKLIQTSLLSIMANFQHYFAHNIVSDPVKDIIGLASSTLLLTDEEYLELGQRLGEVLNDYIRNKPKEGRKARMFTTICSPVQDH